LVLCTLFVVGISHQAQAEEPSTDRALLAQILSMDGSPDRAALIAKLSDKELQRKTTAFLPEIERAINGRRQTLALAAEIKDVGGKIQYTSTGPQWLYQAARDAAMAVFDVPSAIDLYNGNNPLKGKGGRNEKVTDEWLKRLSSVTTLRKLDLANCAIQ